MVAVVIFNKYKIKKYRETSHDSLYTFQNQLKSTVTLVIWFEHFYNCVKNIISVYCVYSVLWTSYFYTKGMFKHSSDMCLC